ACSTKSEFLVEQAGQPVADARLIVGKRHCRFLADHSGAAGIDMRSKIQNIADFNCAAVDDFG
ncbi:hypothetical protein QT971_25290, partial [Microcoleus sp. herbarium19]|uniref:hypothetical protein n=1 Tax=Microcoleus sp. herbarium19 TaxID=3055440 RepID=UPI002FCEA3E9